MLPGSLLKEYADKFYGFGTWNAKIWFIGIEEAGGREEDDVRRRLEAWERNGKRDLEDAPSFYPASGQQDWHGPEAQRQETWAQLVRLLLLARGMPDTQEAILNYQSNQLGRIGGETCLGELLPLPSPSIKDWRYSQWSDLRWLGGRDRYYAHLLVPRATELSRLIKLMSPPIVIFYGTTFFRTWSCVVGATWEQAIPGNLVTFTNGPTRFLVTKHPADPALGDGRDAYFREIGNYLRRQHGGRFATVVEKPSTQGAATIKKTAPLMPARLDWPSAVGNFMLNFGLLDLNVLDFVESTLTPEEFAKVKDWHLHDRVKEIKRRLEAGRHPEAMREGFEGFFSRLEPVRELRNHIAHGLMRLGLTADQKTWELTLSLPRDLDGSYSPDARHLSFEELEKALGGLAKLIEEFEKLSELWSGEMEKVTNP